MFLYPENDIESHRNTQDINIYNPRNIKHTKIHVNFFKQIKVFEKNIFLKNCKFKFISVLC